LPRRLRKKERGKEMGMRRLALKEGKEKTKLAGYASGWVKGGNSHYGLEVEP